MWPLSPPKPKGGEEAVKRRVAVFVCCVLFEYYNDMKVEETLNSLPLGSMTVTWMASWRNPAMGSNLQRSRPGFALENGLTTAKGGGSGQVLSPCCSARFPSIILQGLYTA